MQPASADDIGRELAQWLAEAGRRTRPPKFLDPATELLAYLEELSGRRLRTPEDLRLYLMERQREHMEAERALSRKRLLRETVLIALAGISYLQYYYWDVALEIQKIPALVVLAAPQTPPPPGK